LRVREKEDSYESGNAESFEFTLAYASANKNNASLIDSIIAKAKERKGLSHREAAVLLDCELDEKNQEIFALAEQIKKDHPELPAYETYDELMAAIKKAL